jgi:hypothetical protein
MSRMWRPFSCARSSRAPCGMSSAVYLLANCVVYVHWRLFPFFFSVVSSKNRFWSRDASIYVFFYAFFETSSRSTIQPSSILHLLFCIYVRSQEYFILFTRLTYYDRLLRVLPQPFNHLLPANPQPNYAFHDVSQVGLLINTLFPTRT